MLYSGIDLHRRLIVICTVNETGTVAARTKMRTEPGAVVAYFRQWTVAINLSVPSLELQRRLDVPVSCRRPRFMSLLTPRL